MKISFIQTKNILLIVIFSVLYSLLTVQANAKVLNGAALQQMSAYEIKEFNKQFEIEYKKHNDNFTALAGMKNPYYDIIKSYDEGELGDKSDKKSNNLYAKQERFKRCREVLSGFIPFASKSKRFTTGPGGMNKEDFLKSSSRNFGIAYPLSQEDSVDPIGRPYQLLLDMGWKYRGKGEENVFIFYNACMSIPIKIYEADYED